MESQPPPPPQYQQTYQNQSQGYGAPQASYIPPATVTLLSSQAFRAVPVRTICPRCHADIFTSISYEVGNTTWMWCILGWFFGCCCIPFFIDGCKDVIHTCPLCHCYIHRFNR